MIVFSVAFGEKYIRHLFERCLPSLLRSEVDEPLSLLVFTTPESNQYFPEYMDAPYMARFGDRIETVVTKYERAPGVSQSEVARILSGEMLHRAVLTCFERDEIFVHAVPDLVYSPTALSCSLTLHKLTDRNVAIFNGGVMPGEITSLSADATVDYFFDHMNASWAEHATDDATKVPGFLIGHLVFTKPGQRTVFCASPNPFLGRFNATDVLTLSGISAIRTWDHAWLDNLSNQGRLIVEPDLHRAMSLETEYPALDAKSGQRYLVERWRKNGDDLRRLKFPGTIFQFNG